jgi:hypothetical protein
MESLQYQESRSFVWKMRLLIHEEFTDIRSPERCVYSSFGELNGIRSPGVSYGRCLYSSVESLLVSGVQSSTTKMGLLIHGEFTGIRSPGVSCRRCVYSTMKSLLVPGVQEFHTEDAFTHPWSVYWYQESRSFKRKMRLLIRGKFIGIRSPEVSYGRCV